MNKRALGVLAIIIILLMIVVANAGFDNLPKNLRTSIDSAAARLNSDRTEVTGGRAFVTRALASEPVLFRAKAALFNQRLEKENACLTSASAEMATLQQLAKANRRADAPKVEAELSKFNSLRSGCAQDATQLRAEAERWIRYKHELPQRLTAMKTSYDAVHSFDVDAAVAPVKKAELDWPAKKDDLENRVTQLKGLKAQGEQLWDSSAKLRQQAEANHLEDFDYAAFFDSADRLDETARQLKSGSDTVDQLSAQLYTSWDKLVVDVDNNHGLREKVRIVRTKYKDATLANGEPASEEHWEDAAGTRSHDLEKTVGMVVARKPAGKYDSEVERVVQPPAIAYVAPPGQSNSYGSWNNGVWSWLPQYLILSHMLNASRGPITVPDYEGYYQARRRGEIFYGRGDGFQWWHGSRTAPSTGGGSLSRVPSSPGSGTGGGFYTERPKTYGSGGGYSGSQYQNRGSYGGSRFESRGGYKPGGSFGSKSYSRGGGFGGGGRSFGRGGRR